MTIKLLYYEVGIITITYWKLFNQLNVIRLGDTQFMNLIVLLLRDSHIYN